MKITKSQLKQIIKEELAAVLEVTDAYDKPAGGESGQDDPGKIGDCKKAGGKWRYAKESKGSESKTYDQSRGLKGYCEKKKK
mgnify:CR=1 FL=1